MKHKRQTIPLYRPLRKLSLLLGLTLTVLLAGTFFYLRLPPETMPFDGSQQTNSFPVSLESVFQEQAPQANVLSQKEEPIGGEGSRIVNILLVGQDRREGEERTRSDTMILCTFNKRTREVTLTSFLRDLYVPIPGHGNDRINAAYAYGGMNLLEKTLAQNFDLQVDGTVEVDFSQFSQIIDILGGVDMELRQDEAEFINYETGSNLNAGIHHLDGPQALAYSRIRKLDADGDFSRTSRQRRVLEAMVDAYRGAKLTTVLLLVKDVLPMITTNLDGMELLGYALELFPMLSGSQILQQRIPADGAYQDQNIDGMAVLVPDLEAARELLSETLLGV